jgi:RimJ/RimL family protein N-acetyltransferase
MMVAAVTAEPDGLVGAIGLRLVPAHRRGELGYWIGRAHWNLGYATEAAHALVWYGFTHLDLNRIQAMCFTRNPSSARVMQKVGMIFEGRSRQLFVRWDQLEDVDRYSVLRADYEGRPWPVELG